MRASGVLRPGVCVGVAKLTYYVKLLICSVPRGPGSTALHARKKGLGFRV